jgi:hypothetical protein
LTRPSKVDLSVKPYLYRLIYANVITALEVYLSDAFINTVFSHPDLIRRFIETTPKFQEEKILFSDVYKVLGNINEEALEYLNSIIWYKLDMVKRLYEATLEIVFPTDLGSIFKAILKRHDIVHRNGKDIKGNEIKITSKDISGLIVKVESIVSTIDTQIAIFNIKSRSAENGGKSGAPP